MKRKLLLAVVLTVFTQLFVKVQAKDYWYSFNKDFSDSISGANEGFVTGDVALVWDNDRKSTVAVFNESLNDAGYVTLPAEILNTEQITVSCWAMHNNLNGVGDWGRFWDFGPDNQNYILLTYSEGSSMRPTVDTKLGDVAGPRVQSQDPLVTGVWNHFVVTHGDGTTRLYINGVEVHNQANDQSLLEMYNAGTCTNYIGKSHYNDAPLVGRIDDMKIFGRVVTPEEVALLFQGKSLVSVEKNEAEKADTFAANGSIQINVAIAANGSIEVFDTTGKSIFKTNDIHAVNTISVPGNGLYLVKLTQGGKSTTSKVVVK